MQPSRLADFAPEFSGNAVLTAFLSVMLDAVDPALGWPRRSRMDVARLAAAGALPFIWIMERTADGRYRYRLTGEEVRQNFHRPVKDALVEDVIEPNNARAMSDIYRMVGEQRAVCYSHGPSIGQLYSYFAERILVPACDDAGAPVFVVSCFQRRNVSFAGAGNRRVFFDMDVARFIPLADLTR